MKNKGFTLVEVIVTIAIIAIVTGIGAGAYISYMESQKQNSDGVSLDALQNDLKNAMDYSSVFDEAKAYVDTTDFTLAVDFPVTVSSDGGVITLTNGHILSGDTIIPVTTALPTLCEHMGTMGDGDGTIKLSSREYTEVQNADGASLSYVYRITFQFDGVQISPTRPVSIVKDGMTITGKWMCSTGGGDYEECTEDD